MCFFARISWTRFSPKILCPCVMIDSISDSDRFFETTISVARFLILFKIFLKEILRFFKEFRLR